MPTFGVNNFSKGLDTKRHLISSEAGELQDLVNAHVNRGGEIEKRRAFVQIGTQQCTTVPGTPGTDGYYTTHNQWVVDVPGIPATWVVDVPYYQGDWVVDEPGYYTSGQTLCPGDAGYDPSNSGANGGTDCYTEGGGEWVPEVGHYENATDEQGHWEGGQAEVGHWEEEQIWHPPVPGTPDVTTCVPSNSLPPGTFGLEVTGSGIFVFGSIPQPTWTWPQDVVYQRLQHPDGFAMTGVRWSSVYGAKPFVLAEFNNGDVIPYYNGVAVGSFVNGIVRQYMNNTEGVVNHFKTLFDTAIAEALAENSVLKHYTAVKTNPSTIRLTGKQGVPFEVSTEAEAPMTITTTKVQEATDDVLERVASGSFIIAQGTNGSASFQVGARHAFYGNGAAMAGITGIWVDEQDVELIALASGSPGLKWNSQHNDPSHVGADAAQWYRVIAWYINLQKETTGYYAFYGDYGGGWSGPDPSYLIIYAPNSFAEDANGWTVWLEFETDPAPYASSWSGMGVDMSTLIPSPRNPGRFYARFAPALAGGQRNSIYSLSIDGVELMRPGEAIFWKTSNAQLCDDLVAAVNAWLVEQDPTPDYILSSADTSKVVITARPGSGASFNGRRITIRTNGSVGIVGNTAFSGGRDGLPGKPQITDFTFGGFSLNKKLTITITDSMLTGYPYQIGASWLAGKEPNFTYTYKAKKFAGIDYSIYFSRLNDCTQWDIYDNGSGFINLSNNFSGRDPLTGIGVYQDKLAIFSRRNIQLFDINYDPTNDAQAQVIDGTGTVAPGSVVSANSLDLFFLADNGIRSVKARQNTVSAYSDDVGTPIDTLIINQLATMTEEQKRSAVAIIEPVEGRYWLALGNQVYVLSMYAGSQIFAWSRYEPGFNIQWLRNKDNLVIARSGNNIYAYGGLTGREYDSCPVTVELPYMDAGTPQMYKQGTGVDLTIDGQWTLSAGFDYTAPEARDVICTVNQSTYALGAIPMVGVGTHMGIKMVNQAPGPAKVSNIVVHFRELHSRSSAG